MSPFASFVSRKVLATVAVFALLAAAVVGAAVAGGSDGSQEPTTVDLTAQGADAFDAALADPASALDVAELTGAGDRASGWRDLREDLQAAHALEGAARREALAAIRTKAQAGEYGDHIERRADRRQIHRDLFFSLLPDNLQADLTELRDAPADQRPQLRAEIMDKALAGDYGSEVQDAAEKLRDLRD